jgi:hypothetical protein
LKRANSPEICVKRRKVTKAHKNAETVKKKSCGDGGVLARLDSGHVRVVGVCVDGENAWFFRFFGFFFFFLCSFFKTGGDSGHGTETGLIQHCFVAFFW